jgi:tRNA threonylcarbamoyladenosine biosynthesis protein TsaE
VQPSGRSFTTRSAAETEALGRRIGEALRPREGGAAVCLYGDLGAGKTTFVKGFAAAFGIPGRDVGSASFVIVAEYETKPPFYHIDLYRLVDPCMEDMGLWEYIEGGGVTIIEWAERLGETPEDAITVTFRFNGEAIRTITIDGLRQGELA